MPTNRIENESIIEEYDDNYLYYVDGSTYEGDLIHCENSDSIREGYGIMKYSNGISLYSGYYKNNLKNGHGKFIISNGNTYEGEFLNGIKSGKGKYIFSNGDTYEGEFLNDIKSGKGKYIFSNGDTYEGEFLNDVCWGYGIMISYTKNGCLTYEGEWQNDKKHGKGKYIFKQTYNGNDDDIRIYEEFHGTWVDGKKHGKGKYVYKEKYDINDINDFDDDDELEIQFYEEEFEGTWVNDEKHGQSEFKTKGLWRNDNLISTIESKKIQNIRNNVRRKINAENNKNNSNFDRDRFHYMFPPNEVYEFY